MNQRKAIFITGAGSGIGRAVAQHFAARGWFIGLADINEAGMAETANLLPAGQSFITRLDVRDRAAWDQALAAFAQAAGGRIDTVMNNAGVAYGGHFTDQTEAEIDQLLAVNFKGVINGAQAAWPWLKASAPGSCLLNTASASAFYGTASLAVYSASKFAVRALTEALDVEWRDDHIKVRAILPAFIDTPLLAGPAGAKTNQSKRDSVIAAGLGFTPVGEVAAAAWNAVHGNKLHTPVGKVARQMRLAALFAPGYLRKRSRKLMQTRLGS